MSSPDSSHTHISGYVPEADIRPGQRPEPGRSQFREPWSGSEEVKAKIPRWKDRITGIDAARGFAILGMISVHTIPAWNYETQSIPVAYELFAGRSAQLFALLAGVSLAIISGMRNIHTGRRLRRDRWNVFFRVVLLLLIGSALNYISPAVFNILPYYAMFFLFAIPFLGLGARPLFILAGVFAVVGPLLRFWALGSFDTSLVQNPVTADLFVNPVNAFSSLIFEGVYPAITWAAYIFLGMALGRLDLRSLTVQVRMAAYGILAAFVVAVVSDATMGRFGGFERALEQTPDMTASELVTMTIFGGELPSTSLWLQFSNGPHTNTIASVLFSGALAVAAFGCFLVAARVLKFLVAPLIAAGTMSLTIYVAHVLFVTLAASGVSTFPYGMLLLQAVVVLAFALLWRASFGQGPLERIQANITKSLARVVVPQTEGENEKTTKGKGGSYVARHRA